MEWIERVMYWIRPLKYCHGCGYVKTPGRKDGVPYCLSCKEEENPIPPEPKGDE